eukprot:135040-Ditylum_brightwellii.AAC.1
MAYSKMSLAKKSSVGMIVLSAVGYGSVDNMSFLMLPAVVVMQIPHIPLLSKAGIPQCTRVAIFAPLVIIVFEPANEVS